MSKILIPFPNPANDPALAQAYNDDATTPGPYVYSAGGVAPAAFVKPTYSATLVGFAPVTLATDVFSLSGSDTKIIRVRRIRFTATQTTTGSVPLAVIRRSAANTGGTPAAVTAVKNDTLSDAATAAALSYAGLPSALGAAVGALRSTRAIFAGLAGTVNGDVVFDFGSDEAEQPTLRGAAQMLALNLGGAAALASAAIYATFEWTESDE